MSRDRSEELDRSVGDWVQDEDGRVWRWPFCAVDGCPHRVCVGRSDKFCYPHSGSGQSVAEMIEEMADAPNA